MKGNYETIIVGGGIAGLGCAHTLKKQGRDFLLITETIGGRMETSSDGEVNYGATLITKDYAKVSPYLIKGERIRLSQVKIHHGEDHYAFFPHRPKDFFAYLKLRNELKQFRPAYAHFRKKCETVSQKKALESDPYLHALFKQTAAELVRALGVEDFCRKYLCEGVYVFAFTNIDRINAFEYLHYLQLLITPFYFFTVNKKKLYKPVEKIPSLIRL